MTLIKKDAPKGRDTCWSKGGDTLKLRFLKSLSLADQKVETTPQWKLELRFLKSVSLADQKAETPWSKSCNTQSGDTLIKRQRHPNLGFWSQCVTCWSNGGDNSPSWQLELRFLKSVSLADQKAETPWWKSAETQGIKRCRHPNLGFWSQCHLVIKRWRQLPPWKLELRFLKSVSLADQKAEKPWSKGGNTLIKRCRHPNLGFWSQCHLLIKRWRHPPPVKVWT